jgi:hypothetical protein
METINMHNGECYRATFDVAHYQKTGEIIYTSPRQRYEAGLGSEIMNMLQHEDVGSKRLGYMMDKEKFLHICNQTRMTDDRLAMYFGCKREVIQALKRRYGALDTRN